jgi:hypothetical protein
VAGSDLRDPEADRRRARRRVFSVMVVVAAVVAVATVAAALNRTSDKSYLYTVEIRSSTLTPFEALVPLPSDPEFQAACRFQGNNLTVAHELSMYGDVLHVRGTAPVAIACRLSSWKDLPISLTTEGMSVNGLPAARAFLDSGGHAADSTIQLQITKTDPTWTLSRDGSGDFFEGWNTRELRQTQQRTPSY